MSGPRTPQEITRALYLERPTALDKPYFQCQPWDRGTCDEWNTIVLRFASVLFGMENPAARQGWIEALVEGNLNLALTFAEEAP